MRFVSLVIVALLSVMGAQPALADHDITVTFDDLDEIPDGAEEPPGPWDGFIDARDDEARTTIVKGFVGEAARVVIPALTHRGAGGILRMDPTPDEAWFRYYLRLDSWNASSSGKLPGFAGLYSDSARGCIPSAEESPGWSARTMYEATGTEGAQPGRVRLGTYLYHLGQAGTCGDQILWQPGVVEQGRWYCVEGHVKMNTPGSADGLVEAWVDGAASLRWPDVELRRVGEESIGVRHFWNNIYFGGSVVNSSDLTSTVDQIAVSHGGRIWCVDPFVDDDESPHQADLGELYARSVLLGCGERLACPDDQLTRGQMAALLARALGLNRTSSPFSDTEGHFAENDIGALAAAGITKGCTPTRFCPEDPVSRAEMAVFLDRAFGLDPGASAFDDVSGHWAEASIVALAAAGITKGCTPTSFCPDVAVSRGQVATFLRRGFGFSLAPASVGFADGRLGELAPGTFDDTAEPEVDLD
ncbi:MAG: S-layer homology domain-containing protein [Acidimicrobiia bacterium]|nr:S-layer homology domain-containing protein [Acidimicrobiia bacterium]